MARYRFVDHWAIKAPIEQVFDHVSDPTTYPRWWPVYSQVEVVRNGSTSRQSQHARLVVKSALGYSLKLDVETTESNPPHYLKTVSRGNLEGTGEWTFEQQGDTTHATWIWTVESQHRLLNLLEPIAKSLFAWSHNDASRKGHQGLKKLLEQDNQVAQAERERDE